VCIRTGWWEEQSQQKHSDGPEKVGDVLMCGCGNGCMVVCVCLDAWVGVAVGGGVGG